MSELERILNEYKSSLISGADILCNNRIREKMLADAAVMDNIDLLVREHVAMGKRNKEKSVTD